MHLPSTQTHKKHAYTNHSSNASTLDNWVFSPHCWQKYKHPATTNALGKAFNTLLSHLLTKTVTKKDCSECLTKNAGQFCGCCWGECAPAFVYVCIREGTSGGGEEDNREERHCYSSQFGSQGNNEDCRFHKCCVTQRWCSSATSVLKELPKTHHKDAVSWPPFCLKY